MQLAVILILLLSFSLLMYYGVPISVAVGLSSFLALLPLYSPLLAAKVLAHSVGTSLDNFGLLAIPFFILAGNIMNSGGIARRLIEFAKVLAGPIPGALAYCTVIANMLFGALTGSAVSSAAAVGSALTPLQKKDGYDPAFAAAVNIASSPTGLLVPPSGAFILYALITGGTSITALFVAGYIPSLLMGLGIMAVIAYYGKSLPRAQIKADMGMRLRAFLRALPSLFLMVLVMGGMIGGVFTATEASSISVIYAFTLSLFYREMKLTDLPKVLTATVVTTSVVLFMVATSVAMGWVFAIAEIPAYVSQGLLAISHEPWVVLMIMNLVLLALGTFMDITPALLIFTPIFFPVATSLGVHPVHFGVIIVFNLCIAIVSPPVGSVLFVGAELAGVSLDKVIPKLMPMFIALIATLFIVTYVPALSLWLPGLFGLL